MLLRVGLMLSALLALALGAACSSNGDSVDDPAVSSSYEAGDWERDTTAVDEYNDADMSHEDDVESGAAAQISTGSFERKVIRSAELEIEVSDVQSAVRHARELAESYGGHIDASSARALSDGDQVADVTLEVPSGEFDRVLDELREGPHVVSVKFESTSSRDVTEEYVDLRARLGNLESTETRFVALLDEAETIHEILDVENEISRIRGEIERIQGRLNYLEQRTDYSRIFVSFHPENEESIQIAGQYFTPGETAREAWNASMQFMGAIGNAMIAVSVFFWWGWPLLAVAVLALWRYRRRKPSDTVPAQV